MRNLRECINKVFRSKSSNEYDTHTAESHTNVFPSRGSHINDLHPIEPHINCEVLPNVPQGECESLEVSMKGEILQNYLLTGESHMNVLHTGESHINAIHTSESHINAIHTGESYQCYTHE